MTQHGGVRLPHQALVAKRCGTFCARRDELPISVVVCLDVTHSIRRICQPLQGARRPDARLYLHVCLFLSSRSCRRCFFCSFAQQRLSPKPIVFNVDNEARKEGLLCLAVDGMR